MRYCVRCVYPETTKPSLHFDEHGVCAGCRYHESKEHIDWSERWGQLEELVKEVKRARWTGAKYDCIIPVSGGKDSHYQVWLLKRKLGLNPLLVWFNHGYNSALGIRNLRNLVKRSGCDLVRYDTPRATARKLSRWAILNPRITDLTWHYHAGIMTYPIRVAIEQNIPYIFWGEEGFSEITGLMTLDYTQEFTKWKRTEHSMRGVDVGDILADPEAIREGITQEDLIPYTYPEDSAIETLNLRGLYLGNYVKWDALEQARLMVSEWGFELYKGQRERTFNLYAKTDDHANPSHEWLRYLKFGYGRATDDAATEVRLRRMTREQAVSMVSIYDHQKPINNWNWYLNFLGLREEQVLEVVDTMRDSRAWHKDAHGWRLLDHAQNHNYDEGIEEARLPLRRGVDEIAHPANAPYYWGGFTNFPAPGMVGPVWTL